MNPNDTLFPVPEVKSPRLKWLEKHHIVVTHTYYPNGVPFELDEFDEEIKPWRACKENEAGDIECGFGDDEQEALHALALKLGIPLWNEENV